MTFTIEQIRKYILFQDSLGDVLYNLSENKILDANKFTDITYFETEESANDFLCDLENYQGESFQVGEDIYDITYNVTDFIRDYGYDTYSQMRISIDSLCNNGLINLK